MRVKMIQPTPAARSSRTMARITAPAVFMVELRLYLSVSFGVSAFATCRSDREVGFLSSRLG